MNLIVRPSALACLTYISYLPKFMKVDDLFGKLGTHGQCAGATFWVSTLEVLLVGNQAPILLPLL